MIIKNIRIKNIRINKSGYEKEKTMGAFTGKTLMITGGTGSFGNAVLNRFLKTDIGEIRIFSRDEKKQDDMRHEFQAKMPEVADKIKFYIGDVRDLQSVRAAMPGVDYIFHAAALKQVPSCEFFPMEAVRTNVIGTENVLSVFQQIKQLIQLMQWELQKQSKKKLQSQNPECPVRQRFVVQDMAMLCAAADL